MSAKDLTQEQLKIEIEDMANTMLANYQEAQRAAELEAKRADAMSKRAEPDNTDSRIQKLYAAIRDQLMTHVCGSTTKFYLYDVLKPQEIDELADNLAGYLDHVGLTGQAQPVEQGASETSKTIVATTCSWRNDDPRKHGSNDRAVLAVFGDGKPRHCRAGDGEINWWDCRKWRELVRGLDY